MFRPLLLGCFALSACSTVDMATVDQLSDLSPAKEDPARFQVALDLPESLAIRERSGKLTLSATQTQLNVTETAEATLVPVAAPASGGPVGLGRIEHYRIDPEDLAGLRRVQAKIHEWAPAGEEVTKGSLSITLAGCATGLPEKSRETVSIWLQIEPDGAFLPLVKQAQKTQVLQEGGFEPLEPC